MTDKRKRVKSRSGLFDLKQRVAAAVRIRHVSLGFGVVNPMAVHNETVFVAAGCEEQFPGPFATGHSVKRCGPWFPVIKRADQDNTPSSGRIYFKPNLALGRLSVDGLGFGFLECCLPDGFGRRC